MDRRALNARTNAGSTTPIDLAGDSSGWPADELERVAACPVCGGRERSLLLDGLRDNVFFVAPGRWCMYRCVRCRSGFLDPRPDAAHIGKAYGRYFTHAAGAARADASELHGFRLLRRGLANGYVNARYGTHYVPSSALGPLAARLLPGMRQPLDARFRYLPKPSPGQRVLDVGCGNGDFLEAATDAGWDAVGLEPDPDAAAVGQARGFDVRAGGLEVLDGLSSCFDAVTLNHVIEHLHSPGDALAVILRVLKPGGVLYIDTPNIDSLGAAAFGRHWRGLEPPRHLVLFTPSSLVGLLRQAGFVAIDIKRRPAVAAALHLASSRMARGLSPDAATPARLPLWTRLMLALRPVATRHLEFVTLTAGKPGEGA